MKRFDIRGESRPQVSFEVGVGVVLTRLVVHDLPQRTTLSQTVPQIADASSQSTVVACEEIRGVIDDAVFLYRVLRDGDAVGDVHGQLQGTFLRRVTRGHADE